MNMNLLSAFFLQFLHLSILREYLELEFEVIKKSLPFEFSLERVIDDFIFLGLLVGNDFIPCIPTFYIPNGMPSLSSPFCKQIKPLVEVT